MPYVGELNEMFTGHWGKLMDALVDGDLITLLRERGITVDYTFNNLKRDHDGRTWEIDILAANGTEVVEVKTTLKVREVDHFLETLRHFHRLMPEYGGKLAYGAVAYLKADEGAAVYAPVWTQARVSTFRSDHGIPIHRDGELAERGELLIDAAAQRLGVSMWLYKLIRKGVLPAKQACTDLTERDAHGEPRLIMQADQSVYLHRARSRLPRPVLTIGEHDFPEVVLEVDHTTDARRRKLPQYEAWGFPEVWIEVPDARAPSRPRSRRSGLTIHLLEDGAYREAAASRAFPGWTAAEIHAALNEQTFSAETSAALERVGAVLGEREGTGPDDDPLLGAQRRRSRAEGRREGELRGKVVTIEGLLGHEVPWSTIEAATGIDEPAFRRLKRELAAAGHEDSPN